MRFSKEDTLMVKGVAILMLLFYHLFYYEPMFLEYHVNFAPFDLQSVMKTSRVFNICVSIFLFLTVYGLYKGYEKLEQQSGHALSGRQFLWISLKRYFSLMLGYIAVFAAILIFFFWDLDLKSAYGTGFRAIYYFLMDLTGLSKFFDFPCINGSWWYLQLAILIIFCMPFLYMAFRKIGYLLVPTILLLPYVISVDYMTDRYRYVVLFGLVFARADLFPKWSDWKIGGSKVFSCLVKTGILLVSIGISAFLRQYEGDLVTEEVTYLAEGVLAVAIILLVYYLLGAMVHLRKVTELLGKHSMNMYFAHLFFSYYFVHIRGLIFSGKHFLVIYLLQILMVLGFSVALEFLKKLCRYQEMINRVRICCDQKIMP